MRGKMGREIMAYRFTACSLREYLFCLVLVTLNVYTQTSLPQGLLKIVPVSTAVTIQASDSKSIRIHSSLTPWWCCMHQGECHPKEQGGFVCKGIILHQEQLLDHKKGKPCHKRGKTAELRWDKQVLTNILAQYDKQTCLASWALKSKTDQKKQRVK